MILYLVLGAIAAYAVYQSFFADNRDDRVRRPLRRRDERQHIDASHNDPASLRARARQESHRMVQCYKQSQEAYERRDRARAKSLSDEGKHHALKMENLNARASAIIFKQNNQVGVPPSADVAPFSNGFQDRAACEVDLHGLYVKEAIAYSENAFADARRRGDSEIRLIVGQGNHSDGGVSRLKPAIQEAMKMRGVRVEVDPRNPGVLLVLLGGR